MFNYFHNHFQAFSRGLIRVKSNLSASIMMFIIIGITLCLPSAGYLIVENVRQISTKIQHEAEISIFLKKDIYLLHIHMLLLYLYNYLTEYMRYQ